jgi:signal transduction histidine kinase
MKPPSRASRLLWHLSTLPLSALGLSRGKRVLIVAFSYAVAVPGLWFFLPQVHNAASMLVPIISACWLFRYRGLLICLPTILLAIWLIYLYLSPYALTAGQTFEERAVIGFGIGLLFGLMTCWLRTAVDLLQRARSQALAAEQERLQVSLAYQYQRQLNELKDQFLLNVSHELRTPLTVLGGSLELLQAHDEHLDASKRAQIFTLALENHEELVSLVSRVLDVTHVVSEIPRVQSEVVCLQKLVQEELAALAQADALAYKISVQVSAELKVWADPQLLRQVVRNLLSNVFKYVPTQTEIHIEAVQEVPSGPVCLWVQDAGPGIPAEELPLLFEKFVRLKRDLAGTTRGTGLGLYLCKQVVEAMEGRIWVESSGRAGEGSRFCVSLPPVSPPPLA